MLLSATKCVDYFFNSQHLQQRKITQKLKEFAKVVSKFCQILDRPFKIAKVFKKNPKWKFFAQIWSHRCSCYRTV